MDDSTNNILVNVSHSAGTEIGVELAADREQNQTDSDHARDGSSTEEMMEDEEESDAPVPDNVRVLIRGLIDHYNLSRQQFAAVYDEYEKMKYLESPEQGNDSGGEKRREMRLQIVGEPTLAADRESDIAVGSPEGVPVQKMGGQELQGICPLYAHESIYASIIFKIIHIHKSIYASIFLNPCIHFQVKSTDYRVLFSLPWKHMSHLP